MKFSVWLSSMLVGVILLPAAAQDAPVYDIPQIEGIVIDGDLSDWGEGGFRIDIFSDTDGRVQPVKDFDPKVRLGWDVRGLLLAATVSDDIAFEHPGDNEIWLRDALEIFVGDKKGGKQWWQANIASGMDPDFPKLHYWLFDRGKADYNEKLHIEAASRKIDGGYIVEVLLPWENLSATAAVGQEYGFQMYCTDHDKEGGAFGVQWFPARGTHVNSANMHRIRLAEEASPAVSISHGSGIDQEKIKAAVRVVGTADRAGSKVTLMDGEVTVAEGELKATEDGRASAELLLAFPAGGEAFPAMTLKIDGEGDQQITLGDPGRWLAEQVMYYDVQVPSAVFSGETLPQVMAATPERLEQMIGPFTLDTEYYDAEYNEVTSAETPGRYAAVVTITTEDARQHRRFVTLYRSPVDFSGLEAATVTAAELGIGEAAQKAHPAVVQKLLNDIHENGFNFGTAVAVTLAGLAETAASDMVDDWYTTPDKLDRQWWVGMKRQLYHWADLFPDPIVCPQKMDGPPATVLHEGTLEEAGMDAEGVKKVDALLTEWSQNTNEAFAVCIARNGVIVLEKAYGQRDGRPMTLKDRSWMASITKMLSGTLLMMAVDQELIDLDEPAENFLPPLKGTQERPWTFRDLYNHTDDLDGHWGSRVNDMEERAAALAPLAKVGRQYRYNGTGLELACKALEGVSGEAIPYFFRNHLLIPLGMNDTYVDDACGGASSVPRDMAKVGQMLLNRGAYGDMRFFREETFEQMLPKKLAELYDFETTEEYGVGTSFFKNEGLGEGTFAHGAASAATFRIDPVNQLVIIMTRNAGGDNFSKYHGQFIQAVADAIIKTPTSAAGGE